MDEEREGGWEKIGGGSEPRGGGVFVFIPTQIFSQTKVNAMNIWKHHASQLDFATVYFIIQERIEDLRGRISDKNVLINRYYRAAEHERRDLPPISFLRRTRQELEDWLEDNLRWIDILDGNYRKYYPVKPVEDREYYEE